ncbi:hypothetical protein BpHYR1_029024 [Brachionus plicatilis]|uniref:Uncharacterized protein n=1 Tax=Brachionus plicatilis TaxID=10195 RepID=A0A3M7SWA0_BRAPC|nr:hypothetical protein BpHYR1_029024 [Brachionus plicatilis]
MENMCFRKGIENMQRAANSNDTRKILSLAEKPYDDDILIHLPRYSADRQVIQREQKANKPNYPDILLGMFFLVVKSIAVFFISSSIKNDYSTNKFMREKLILPQCLAYLPCNDVIIVFNEPKTSEDLSDTRVKDFYDYVEENYVVKYSVKRGQKTPTFSTDLLNVHDRLMQDLPKTNNACESWHNSLSGLLNVHPLINELIDALIKEQNKMETNWLKFNSGLIVKNSSSLNDDSFVKYDPSCRYSNYVILNSLI